MREDLTTKALRALYSRLLRPALFKVDAEKVHVATIATLGHLPEPVLSLMRSVVGVANQPITVAGINIPGRVGLAAGMDKDGHAAKAWASLGFGFAEFGTVTAKAQPGNPGKRLFRVPEMHAFVNRMGFNNEGAAALAKRLTRLGVERGNNALGLPVGVSLGKTKVVPIEAAKGDYLLSMNAVAGVADYVAVNVSSPNTPGLRDLQDAPTLARLVEALVSRASEFDAVKPIPVFVKLAPDLGNDALLATAKACESAGAAGLIAVNTTVGRPSSSKLCATSAAALAEEGGLSGAPLKKRAREVVGLLHGATSLPIMASGGVMTPHDATKLFDAGAVLVQVLSGFVYYGPSLVRGINRL